MSSKKTFNLSGDFGKAVLLWVSSPEGQKWVKDVQEQKSAFDWENNPHKFIGLKEDVKNKGYVNIFLKFDGAVSNHTQGFCVSNGSKKLEIEQTKQGEKEYLPTFGFSNHQRKLGGNKMEDLLAMSIEERNKAAPRDQMGAIYADAKFALLKHIALICEFHPWCKNKITNITNCIQTEYAVKDTSGNKTKETKEMPLETQVCRTKLLFAPKGFHQPTEFFDMAQKIEGTNKYHPATVDDEEINKYNVHRWMTPGSSNMVFEYWDSIALTSMGKNVQVYVTKLITNHRDFDNETPQPDDYMANYAMEQSGIESGAQSDAQSTSDLVEA